MTWQLKTSGLGALCQTCIVIDPTDSDKLKDLGVSQCALGAGITYSGAQIVVRDRSGAGPTADGFGKGIYTAVVPVTNNPGSIQFSDAGHGLPKWIDGAVGGTVVMLLNRTNSGDNNSGFELLWLTDTHQAILAFSSTMKAQAMSSLYTVGPVGTTTVPNDKGVCISMYAKMDPTPKYHLYFGQKGGAVAEEGTPVSINDAGGADTTIKELGKNINQDGVELEYFAVMVFRGVQLTTTQIQSIMDDFVGTMIDTGGTPGNAGISGVTDAESVPSETATGGSGSVTLTLKSDSTTLLANKNLRAWTRNTIDGAVVDGGSGGLNVTTSGSGVLVVAGLSIASGSRILTIVDPSDPNNSHNYPITVS